MSPARQKPIGKGNLSMKNHTTKLFLILFAVITMLVLSAVAAEACSLDMPVGVNAEHTENNATIGRDGAVVSGYKDLVGGDSVGVLLTGKDGKDGKDGAGGLVVIRPGDENTAADGNTDTPADPWQTGGLHYKDASLFPDEAFRNYLDAIDSDKNGSISPEEARAYFEKNDGCLDLTNLYDTIYDYTGVECFAEWLTGLLCKPTGGVPLKLDVSGLPLLEELVCSGCALTALDLSNNPALRVLDCGGNPMETLDLSGCPLLVAAAENGVKQEDASGATANYTKDEAILIFPSAARLITGVAPTTDDGRPADPEPSDPSDETAPAAEDLCQWCGGTHNGFFGKITALFHSLLAFFARLFGR